MNRHQLIALTAAVLLAAVVLTSCGGPRSLTEIDAPGLYSEGLRLYENGKYRQAIEYFQAIVFNYPGNSVVDTAQYYLGLSYFGNKDYELAAVEFNRLVLNYPASTFFENALFMRAVSYYEATPDHSGLDQTDLQRAIDLFEDFLIDYPESKLVPDVKSYLLASRTRMAKKLYNSGIVYERIGAWDAAKIYFQKVIDDYTDTEYGEKAAYHKALAAMKQKNYSEARTLFEGFVAAFPNNSLAAEARQKAAEAAFRDCRKSYTDGKFHEARQCLQNFQETYPANGWADDAEELLDEINDNPAAKDSLEHAGT